MKRYEIQYTNKKGNLVLKISRGETGFEAFEKYAKKVVFGGNTIFCNYKIKMFDQDTRGENWVQYDADDINVLVSILN